VTTKVASMVVLHVPVLIPEIGSTLVRRVALDDFLYFY
jgi:hypothetical protein